MKSAPEVPLLEVAEGIFDGPHATPPESLDGPIFLRLDNITPEGRLDLTDLRFINQTDFPRWTRRVTPLPGDVVFSYEATLHRYVVIPDGFHGCLGRRLALIRPKRNRIEPRYLHYYFLSPRWRAVAGSAIINGATVDRISLTLVRNLPIRLPPLKQQRRIVEVLSTYDDLIENNRRRIALLEESARLLYQEWFVRLRFPGHEHVRIVDGVPEGWERRPLKDFCPDLRDSAQPGDLEPGTPYIGLEHIPRRSITLLEWGEVEDVTSTKLRFGAGDILFGKIRPYFHKVGFALTDGIASSDAIVLRPVDPTFYMFSLLTLSSDWFVAIVSKTAKEGSKMPRADWKLMENHLLAVPPRQLLELLNQFVDPVVEQLRALAFQNQKLRNARDLLLPRLMNGEISK